MGARRRVLALVAAAALVATGCGGGGDDEVATVRQLDLLDGAKAAGSARISMGYDVEIPGAGGVTGGAVRIVSALEGLSDFAAEQSTFSGTATITTSLPDGAVDEVVDGPTSMVEMRTVGPDSWERNWPEDEDPGPWRESWRDDDEQGDEGSGSAPTTVACGEASSGPQEDGAGSAPTTVASGGASPDPQDEGAAAGGSSAEGDDIYGQHGNVVIVDGDVGSGDGASAEDDPCGDQGDPAPDPALPEAAPPTDDDPPSPLAALDPTNPDPTRFLEALRDQARSFTEEGSDTVRGEDTTRFRADIDVGPDDEDSELWPAGEQGVVRVWLDGEDRVRRVEVGALELEMWDFGVEVAVEPPTEVTDEYEDLEVAEVVGPWSAQSTGTIAGRSWTVFAAPGRDSGVDVTCRTLEVEGVDAPDLDGEDFGIALPTHDGVGAACGASGAGGLGFGIGLGVGPGVVPDPAVQVLLLQSDGYDDVGGLVAFAVSPRFRDMPLRLVRDGADHVDLPLDGTGVGVWNPAGSPVVTAVELAGGAVRCPVLDPATAFGDDGAVVDGSGGVVSEDGASSDEVPGGPAGAGDAEPDPDAGLRYGVQPCVSA